MSEGSGKPRVGAARPIPLEDLLRLTGQAAADRQREASAQLIRDELVCCDIYQRLEDSLTQDGYRQPTYAHRTLRNSVEYHAICHFGEWAARIVEKGPRE